MAESFALPGEAAVDGPGEDARQLGLELPCKLAVLAVMFSEGAANPLLATLWKTIPAKEGDKKALADQRSALEMLPAERDYYEFPGSLTTPPCSEGVLWLVLKQPSSASKAQVNAFTKTMGFANNRPVQPLNARQVLAQIGGAILRDCRQRTRRSTRRVRIAASEPTGPWWESATARRRATRRC